MIPVLSANAGLQSPTVDGCHSREIVLWYIGGQVIKERLQIAWEIVLVHVRIPLLKIYKVADIRCELNNSK